jgi:hypothetical protein
MHRGVHNLNLRETELKTPFAMESIANHYRENGANGPQRGSLQSSVLQGIGAPGVRRTGAVSSKRT